MKEPKKYYYRVDKEKIDIINHDWRILVILDACRYDVFREVYREIFGKSYGSLKKAISPATWTVEWLNKVFDNRYCEDIIYISGNPYINSKKKVCGTPEYGRRRCVEAKKHFFKVIDVWDFGWNNKLGTVHPIEINKAFHKAYLRYPKNRFIIHYMQPHQPYITLGKGGYGMSKIPKKKTLGERIFKQLLSQTQIWMIKKWLNMPPGSKIEEIFREGGKKEIIRVYKNEVKYVLKYVKMLTDSIHTDWLITADHGERLANFWLNSHSGIGDREVIEVPWFEIKNATTSEGK